jgi:hypothetical protein
MFGHRRRREGGEKKNAEFPGKKGKFSGKKANFLACGKLENYEMHR